MQASLSNHLKDITEKMRVYLEKGQKDVTGENEESESEKEKFIRFDPARIKPIRKMAECNTPFFAVDCSTRTLKRAYNWGIYLFRVVYVAVRGREVQWDHHEFLQQFFGSLRKRQGMLRKARFELESQLALRKLGEINEGDYLLLDGASYFGGEAGFQVSLYEKCKGKGVRFLAVSKQSPLLRDEKGRDFQAKVVGSATYPMWVYHPVVTANVAEHLYGDISIAKLCESSPRAFRIDLMNYLVDSVDVSDLLAPLTVVSEDPRCAGYPVALWLAHDLSKMAEEKLLYYHDLVEEYLAEAGLLEDVRREENSCSFADELHGIKRPFQREVIEYG